MAKRVLTVHIELNGTATNPYERFGLTQNPFPQIAEYQFLAGCLALQKLGGPPIPHARPGEAEAYIAGVLEGFDPEFVRLLAARFVPGQMTRVELTFPAGGEEVSRG